MRRPEPRTLILGCAASTLVAFCFLTTMHERYAYAAIGFLMILIPERPVRWLGVIFGVVFFLNLLSAIPPTDAIHALIPYNGPIPTVGSIVMVALTVATVWLLARPGRTDPPEDAPATALGSASAPPG